MPLRIGMTVQDSMGGCVRTGFEYSAALFGWFVLGCLLGLPSPVCFMALVVLVTLYVLH
ncbi:ribose ABC transporter permease, partial [Cronobacter sakazakii]